MASILKRNLHYSGRERYLLKMSAYYYKAILNENPSSNNMNFTKEI